MHRRAKTTESSRTHRRRVPGATIKAVETGSISRDTVSGADGRYNFTSLRPATYDITAELTGFRSSQRKGVVLQANQNLTANFALELGNLSETVTVSGEAATVDVTSATISEVVDSKRIVELPLNGRDAAKLSTLVAGMVLTAVDRESGKTIPGALRLSTNGTESRQVSFDDGTNHTVRTAQTPFQSRTRKEFVFRREHSAGRGTRAQFVKRHACWNERPHGGSFGYSATTLQNRKTCSSATKGLLKRKPYCGYMGGHGQRKKTLFFAVGKGTHQNIGATAMQRSPLPNQAPVTFRARPRRSSTPGRGSRFQTTKSHQKRSTRRCGSLKSSRSRPASFRFAFCRYAG